MNSHLSIVGLLNWANGVLSGFHIMPMFPSRIFSGSDFVFRSLVHLLLVFLQGDKEWSIFILLQVGQAVFRTPFDNDACFSPVYVLASLSTMKSLKLCVLMFGLGLCVCFCARIILFCYYSSVIRLKIQFVIPPTLFFLLRIILSSIFYCSLFHDVFFCLCKG